MLNTSVRLGLGLVGLVVVLGCAPTPPIDDRAAGSPATLAGHEMLVSAPNAAGRALTVTATGSIDPAGPFFTPLGLNGRFCNSCHQFDQGWSITPAGLQARFDATAGTDPIFQFDGLNYLGAPQGTPEERRASSSLLLGKGVIAIRLPGGATSPNGAQRDFRLVAVDNPYPAAPGLPAQVTIFRRPLPTTNLFAVTSVNWDGRNTPADPTKPGGVDILLGLMNQANGATVLHAQQPTAIDMTTRQAIVAQELSLRTAQDESDAAGILHARGATGGAAALLRIPFTFGTTNAGHTFGLYDAWVGVSGGINDQRAKVVAGQVVFNTRMFGAGGSCSGCHDDPNLGNSSTALRFFDIGVSDPARRAPDVPLYTFERLDGPGGMPTGELQQTTDPGRALISAKWTDMNRFKVPTLRGLAARAPYFHDGSAATIRAVVDHYQAHFAVTLAGDEEDNLVAFLESL